MNKHLTSTTFTFRATGKRDTQFEVGKQNSSLTLLSELGSSKNEAETSVLSSLQAAEIQKQHTSQTTARTQIAMSKNNDRIGGSHRIAYECVHPILRMCSKKKAAAPSTTTTTCAREGGEGISSARKGIEGGERVWGGARVYEGGEEEGEREGGGEEVGDGGGERPAGGRHRDGRSRVHPLLCLRRRVACAPGPVPEMGRSAWVRRVQRARPKGCRPGFFFPLFLFERVVKRKTNRVVVVEYYSSV